MKQESLKLQAYHMIKQKIISCEYLPNTFLNEGIIREEINVSRTPIREALNRLEQENLVKIIPKKGIMITDLSFNEISMIYETRYLIEPFILRTHGAGIDKGEIEKLRPFFVEGCAPEKLEQAYEVDDRLHNVLMACCANSYLQQSLAQIYVQNCRVRILSGAVLQRVHNGNHEHLRIIDAVLEGDLERAAVAMSEHLANAKTAAFSRLIDNGGWKMDP